MIQVLLDAPFWVHFLFSVALFATGYGLTRLATIIWNKRNPL